MGGRAYPAVALGLAGCLLLGGCTLVREAVGTPTDPELLEMVSLTEDDAAPEAFFQPYEGGTEVQGRTSLDLCYGAFPSEDLRIGRQQVGIGDGAGVAWVSSEAILYSSPAEAEQGMAELADARATCPDEPVPAPSGDQEPLTWTFADPPDADWPDVSGVTRQAYAFGVTNGTGGEVEGTATYLQRGRMILALYATPPDSAAAVIRNAPSPARFTEVMSNRLAKLPGDALEQPNPGDRPDDPTDVTAGAWPRAVLR